MNHRTVSGVLCALSLLAIFVGHLLLRDPGLLGVCPPGTQCLSYRTIVGIAQPLAVLWPLPIIFAGLMLVRKEAFIAWALVVPLVSISLVWIVLSGDAVPHGFLEPSRSDYAKGTSKFLLELSVVMVVISYLYIYRNKLRFWRRM